MPDPAAGKYELPGGHLEQGETPRQAAVREWQEETGLRFPDGEFTATWVASNGIYQGFVYTIACEADLDIFARQLGSDPDGDVDGTETISWWDPETIPGNPAVRAELLANIDDVMAALGYGVTGDATTEAEEVAKAGGARPKRPAWHGWTLDQKTAAHWAPKVRDSVRAAVPKATARDMGRDYLADHPQQDGAAPDKRDRNKAAAAWIGAWLGSRGITMVSSQTAEAIAVDGYAIGAVSAAHQVTGETPGAQKPGDTSGALDRIEEAGLAAALALLLHGGNGNAPAAEAVAEAIASGYGNALAIILAGTDADWADSQDTLDELGDLLSEALADEDTAVTLVGTQINIYTGMSAMEYYLANTTSLLSWVAVDDARTCPACLANAAAEPRHAGEAWPGGVTSPPQHPGGCRCSLVPADLT